MENPLGLLASHRFSLNPAVMQKPIWPSLWVGGGQQEPSRKAVTWARLLRLLLLPPALPRETPAPGLLPRFSGDEPRGPLVLSVWKGLAVDTFLLQKTP